MQDACFRSVPPKPYRRDYVGRVRPTFPQLMGMRSVPWSRVIEGLPRGPAHGMGLGDSFLGYGAQGHPDREEGGKVRPSSVYLLPTDGEGLDHG